MNIDTEHAEKQNRLYETTLGSHRNSLNHLDKMDNGTLLAYLDDIVQVLALEDAEHWMLSNEAHRTFRRIISEVRKRLNK